MGLINLIAIDDGVCETCGKTIDLIFQFEFGGYRGTYYHLGDKIEWDFDPRILDGEPGLGEVEVEAVAHPCPECKSEAVTPKYQLLVIKDDLIVKLKPNYGERPTDQEQRFWIVDRSLKGK